MRAPLFHLKKFFGTFTLVLGLAGLLGSPTLQAADCKGLSMGKCEGSDACTWVNSYKTKTGKTVDAYCRSKPSKDTKSNKADDKKDADGKTTDKKKDKEKDAKKEDKAKKSEVKTTEKKKASDKKKSEKKKSDKKKSDTKKSDKKSSPDKKE